MNYQKGPFSNSILDRELAILDCYPGGNDTYLVVAPRISREDYPRANKVVLERFPVFEQGGFVEPATNQAAVARLQMAGGEFCGNATRACAALLADDMLGNSQFGSLFNYSTAEASEGSLTFRLEVSGTEQSIEATVVRYGDGWWASVGIPLPLREVDTRAVTLRIAETDCLATVVQLEGITHILVLESDLPFKKDASWMNSCLKEAVRQLALEDLPALGLIWVSREADAFAIKPIVWVRALGTCFYESACGSGSAALAIAMARRGSVGLKSTYRIFQPSEQPLEVSVVKTPEGWHQSCDALRTSVPAW